MTTVPLTPAQWRAALKAEGVRVQFVGGWETAGRDSATGKPFGPVHGVAIHHTAGANSLAIVRDGRSDLPGPLAHAHLAKDGWLTQLSVKRTNHFGSIARNAYDAVVAESRTHPQPDVAEPIDGNDALYGLEIENLGTGKDPYPEVQYDQAVRWAAAICRAHGWSEHSVIGHKEGTRRKVDPSFSMLLFRVAVADRLAHPASWDPNEEDDVALSTDDINKVASAVAVKLIAGGGVLEASDVTRVANAVAAKPVALTDAQIQAIAASPALAENIAEKVAAKLAARLAN